MSLPYFFIENISSDKSQLTLEEETSRHIVQVLRMEPGEKIHVTDGKGQLIEGVINKAYKKECTVSIVSLKSIERKSPSVTIAISLIKNSARFEWFLEKATELGTSQIIPLICERTERQKMRFERLVGICKSAMLQSMQTWLPVLYEPRGFKDVVGSSACQQKMIAYCGEDVKRSLSSVFDPSLNSHIILIGPEGDFTLKEIQQARDSGFLPVSLSSTRLRTETAGLFAAVVCRGEA